MDRSNFGGTALPQYFSNVCFTRFDLAMASMTITEDFCTTINVGIETNTRQTSRSSGWVDLPDERDTPYRYGPPGLDQLRKRRIDLLPRFRFQCAGQSMV